MRAAIVLALAVVAAANLITSLPGIESLAETQYAGYITVNNSFGGNLFYWAFESRGDPTTDPVILWMTGGPGCSGELALFEENGPYKVESNMSLSINPYSWNNVATIIYIDQPYGAGFSYCDASSDYINNEIEMADDMYEFLMKWFVQYPQYNAGQEFFIIGESYGGHYVPALSARVVKGNNNGANPKINFKGCAIGNGMVDPALQFPQYGPFAFDNKLITKSEYLTMNRTVTKCENYIDNEDWSEAYDECLSLISDVEEWTGINPYNINLQCGPYPLCYNFNDVTTYLNLPAVQKSLGVDRTWASCNDAVNAQFVQDWVTSYAEDAALVLANGFRVMAYSGTLDFICNWYGGRTWANQLDWPNQSNFANAAWQNWVESGTTVGEFKSYAGFSFVAVYNAGHMVPMDQPVNALALVTAFLNGQLPPTA